MVSHHVQRVELFKQKPPRHLGSERAIEEMVQLFLGGVRRG
jgi:hypothetical protein